MTEAIFYVLGEQHIDAQQHFACRLTEKAASQRRSVLIHAQNAEQAQRLDALLWTFRADAFVPHARIRTPSITSDKAADAPSRAPIDGLHEAIAISSPETSEHVLNSIKHHDVLINLASALPPFYSRFERLIEIVIQEDTALATTRAHYKHLRERGYPIKHQDMRL